MSENYASLSMDEKATQKARPPTLVQSTNRNGTAFCPGRELVVGFWLSTKSTREKRHLFNVDLAVLLQRGWGRLTVIQLLRFSCFHSVELVVELLKQVADLLQHPA